VRKSVTLLVLATLVIISLPSLSFSQVPSAANKTYRGDINENGAIDIFDLLDLLKMLSNPDGFTDRSKRIADVNSSGNIEIFDLLELLKLLSGVSQPQVIDLDPLPGEIEIIQGIELAFIPSGSFQMGTNNTDYDWLKHSRPVHTVSLDSFRIGVYEIAQEQYQEIMGTNPSNSPGYDKRPVEQVSWYDVVEFCNRLSVFAGLDSCYNLTSWECDFTKHGFRLPTEAEWEYACRAGTITNYYTGNSLNALDKAGWYEDNSGETTHPVGEKEPNAWGLYDMHGNVWEWCNDWWSDNYSGNSEHNPTGPNIGSYRIFRGGSWTHDPYGCRSAYRVSYSPNNIDSDIGFRVVLR